jgi:hypothetical protein
MIRKRNLEGCGQKRCWRTSKHSTRDILKGMEIIVWFLSHFSPYDKRPASQDEDKVDYIRRCIQKFPDSVDKEIYAYNNKHSLRSNSKGYGGKTH